MQSEVISFYYTKEELDSIRIRSGNNMGTFVFVLFVLFISSFGLFLMSRDINEAGLFNEVLNYFFVFSPLISGIFLTIFFPRHIKNMKRWYSAEQRMYFENGVFIYKCGEHVLTIEKNLLIKIVVSKNFCKMIFVGRFNCDLDLFGRPQIPLRIISKNEIMKLAKDFECDNVIFKKSSGMR